MSDPGPVTALKAELKAAGITYADLARELGMAESSIKRIFAKADMPLSRIDEVLRVLKMDFADTGAQGGRCAAAAPRADARTGGRRGGRPQLLLVAICALSQWTFEQIVATHAHRSRVREVPAAARQARLHRAAPAEPLPAQGGQGLPLAAQRPGHAVLPQNVVDDYFSGGFDAEADADAGARPGRPQPAATFMERAAARGQDFAQQHLADQKLAPSRSAPTPGGGHALVAVRGLPRSQSVSRTGCPEAAQCSGNAAAVAAAAWCQRHAGHARAGRGVGQRAVHLHRQRRRRAAHRAAARARTARRGRAGSRPARAGALHPARRPA